VRPFHSMSRGSPTFTDSSRAMLQTGVRYPQHPRSSCIGGHFTEPKEQNTQQSPALGRNSVLQLVHS
jgi:hypothetical protein